jgi:hypothetical protein
MCFPRIVVSKKSIIITFVAVRDTAFELAWFRLLEAILLAPVGLYDDSDRRHELAVSDG